MDWLLLEMLLQIWYFPTISVFGPHHPCYLCLLLAPCPPSTASPSPPALPTPPTHPEPLTCLSPAGEVTSPRDAVSSGNRHSCPSDGLHGTAGQRATTDGYPYSRCTLTARSPGSCEGMGSVCVSSSCSSAGPGGGGFGPKIGSGKFVMAPALS